MPLSAPLPSTASSLHNMILHGIPLARSKPIESINFQSKKREKKNENHAWKCTWARIGVSRTGRLSTRNGLSVPLLGSISSFFIFSIVIDGGGEDTALIAASSVSNETIAIFFDLPELSVMILHDTTWPYFPKVEINDSIFPGLRPNVFTTMEAARLDRILG